MTITVTQYVIAMVLCTMVLFHGPLWFYAVNNLDIGSVHGLLTLLTLIVVVFTISALLYSFIAILLPWLVKPLCALFIVANACALYFMVTYSVILDKSMMGNIFNTRSGESFEFLHIKLIAFVLLLGVLPAILVSRFRIAPVSRLRVSLQTFVLAVIALIFIYSNSSTWLWFDQHSKQLGGKFLPLSYLVNTARLKFDSYQANKSYTLLPDASPLSDNRLLVVLVIGETARSQNFSLYGYERETNPQLQAMDVAVLRDTKACSTYTTASLNCMLSHNGQPTGSYESLPSYLQRSGIDVVWRSNNWGEPTLNVGTYEKASELRKKCKGTYCEFDDVLLHDLQHAVQNSPMQKVFVALHTKGSHGPAYHERYPDGFDAFKPVCRSVELDKCDSESLINAYDNTVLYTDDFLSRSIQLLENFNDIPTVLLYISDHGESLGEYGLYLHGTPYAIAPDVQKNVPFLVWMSEQFQQDRGIASKDLERLDSHTHSAVFHSVLGAFGMQSPVYRSDLDIFSTPSQVVN